MGDYKAGTVALVSLRRPKSWGGDGIHDGGTYLAIYDGYSNCWVSGEGDLSPAGPSWIHEVKPLVVLDLDTICSGGSREGQGAAIAYCIENHTGNDCELVNRLAAQIREQTKPPRIPEPGLWGVVSAFFNGRPVTHWVRYEDRSGACWRDPFGDTRTWSELTDPTLVRDGIES